MPQSFLGVGWGFPVAPDAGGALPVAAYDESVRQAVWIVLGTAKGERVMRPEFGCAIHDYVFAPVDATSAGRLAVEVRQSLERWEPRIDVLDVSVTPADDDPATLYIDIRYTVRGTYDPRNLVFPFYVIPAEEPAT